MHLIASFGKCMMGFHGAILVTRTNHCIQHDDDVGPRLLPVDS
jgi:hypothetical protein